MTITRSGADHNNITPGNISIQLMFENRQTEQNMYVGTQSLYQNGILKNS